MKKFLVLSVKDNKPDDNFTYDFDLEVQYSFSDDGKNPFSAVGFKMDWGFINIAMKQGYEIIIYRKR